MTSTHYDIMDRAGLEQWLRRTAGSSEQRQERLRRNLRQAMERELTARQRELVRLYYEEGCTMPVIAQRLGVNKSTVCRGLRRARQRLAGFLRYSL